MNPELRRNLWLEISPHRLFGMPVLLGLVFLAVAAIDKVDPAGHVGWVALAGFMVLTVLWGTRLAANSLIDELSDRTWDWQRLATLGPWTMAWGKVLGAPVFAWYGGLLCLLVYLFSPQTGSALSPGRTVASLILMALTLHASALASALHIAQKLSPGAAPNRRSSGIALMFVLLYLLSFLSGRGFQNGAVVHWYHSSVNTADFALCSLILSAFWALTGAYRAMCQSLAVRTVPWVWLGFVLFLTGYLAGFVVAMPQAPMAPLQAVLETGLVLGAALTYLMLLTEPSAPVGLRRLLRKAQARDWRRAAEELPLWPVTWVFATVCALGLTFSGADMLYPILHGWTLAPLALVLLIARDAAILLFFSASAKPKRAASTTLVYILVLDWILPGLLYAAGLPYAASLILPLGGTSVAIQVLSGALQAGVAGWLAYRKMKRSFASFRRADGG